MEERGDRRAACAAVLGFLLPAAGTLWHVLQRTSPPTWDDAWYLDTSFRLWDILVLQGPLDFLKAYGHAFRIKAPLIALLPFPFYALFGKGMVQALLVNLASMLLASVFSYRIGRGLHSGFAGACAVWSVNLMPLLYGLSRVYYVECSLAALTVAFMHFLLAGGSRWALGLLLGLGLLDKITFPLYVLAPALLLYRRGRTGRDWLLIGALGGALAATWYVFNWSWILRFAGSASVGATARTYGSGTGLEPALRYFAALAGEVGAGYHWALAGAALAFVWGRGTRAGGRRWLETGAFAGWAILPLLVLACSQNRDVRYAAPALAGASVGLGVLLAAALERAGRFRSLAAAAFLLYPGCLYWEQTTGWRLPLDPRGRNGATALHWNGPPLREGRWGQEAVFESLAVEALAKTGRTTVVMGLDSRYFSASTGEYYAGLYRWPLRFLSVSKDRTAESALKRVSDADADFVVIAEGFPESELPGFLNRANEGLKDYLASGRFPFAVSGRHRLTNGAVVVVYRRLRP